MARCVNGVPLPRILRVGHQFLYRLPCRLELSTEYPQPRCCLPPKLPLKLRTSGYGRTHFQRNRCVKQECGELSPLLCAKPLKAGSRFCVLCNAPLPFRELLSGSPLSEFTHDPAVSVSGGWLGPEIRVSRKHERTVLSEPVRRSWQRLCLLVPIL